MNAPNKTPTIRRSPTRRLQHLVWLCALFLLCGRPSPAAAQGTAFTYQGRLQDGGVPATGNYEMRFVLCDAPAGNQVSGTPIPSGSIAVSNGQFTATLDFGATAFNGSARWLEIGVRPGGSAAPHTVLVPRQPLTATPYSTMAGSAANFTGQVADSQLSGNVARLNAPQSFNGTVAFNPANGAPFTVSNTNRVTNLHADLLDGYSASAFWNIGGNVGAGSSNFLGTVDNQPLQFRVNNTPALRLEPNATSPNLVGGNAGNHIPAGVVGATIGGGGAPNASNVVGAVHGTVGGGRANRVLASFGFVGGGDSNVTAGTYGIVAGGYNNQATAPLAAVVGGGTNVASGLGAVVGGGSLNTAIGLRSTVAGGANNTANGSYSVVSGGSLNNASGLGVAILGGIFNEATNSYATVLGGFGNIAWGYSSYAAGNSARSLHDGTFVWSDISSPVPISSTAPNQFLIRAAGGVGIGLPPDDAALDVEGNMHLNDYDFFLRGGSDHNHGLGWFGVNKPFAGATIDGPVTYGWAGGALGTVAGGQRIALQWNSAGYVGLGTSPTARLHVADAGQTVGLFESSHTAGTWLSLQNSAGGRKWSIISTGPGNGESAGQLLFYAEGAGGTRVTFRDSGNVGIGTTLPGERLEVSAPDATLRLKNQNDALGGFIGNTFSALEFGLYNPTAVASGIVPPGVKRSFFGFDNSGKVGSLLNNFFAPQFRNLLDDGNGNMTVNPSGSLNFGATTRQMVNLWNANYGIGVQNNTFYSRSDGNFAWFRGGSHAENAYDAGGGTTLMRLDAGGLTVNGTFISLSDRERKENVADVDRREVLNQLAAVPIRKWSYKDDTGVRHIGPMAQDFHAAFGVGPDDKHIAMVDVDGVALAAIQALHEVVKEKEDELAALQKANQDLQKRLANLEKAMARLDEVLRKREP